MGLNASGSVNRRTPVASRAIVSSSLSVSSVKMLDSPGWPLSEGLRSKLVEQEACQAESRRIELGWIGLHGLIERPPPALAVVCGGGEVVRSLVGDRRAVDRHGRSGLVLAPPSVRLAIIREGLQRRQRLEPPGLATRSISQERLPQRLHVRTGG